MRSGYGVGLSPVRRRRQAAIASRSARRHVQTAQRGRGVPVLRNWILGFVATALWTTNYVVYFARDIRAWYRRGHRPGQAGMHRPEHSVAGPLPADQMRPFPPPPPPPPPVRDAEVVVGPAPRSRHHGDTIG